MRLQENQWTFFGDFLLFWAYCFCWNRDSLILVKTAEEFECKQSIHLKYMLESCWNHVTIVSVHHIYLMSWVCIIYIGLCFHMLDWKCANPPQTS